METIELKKRALHQMSPKQLRMHGFIPGVLYGEGKASLPILVTQTELKQLTSHRGEIFNIKLEGDNQTEMATMEAIQIDPVKRMPIHISFLRADKGHKTHVKVPIKLTGSAPGSRGGGIVNQYLHEVELIGLPQDLPTKVELSIDQLNKGDFLRLDDLALPKNVRLHEHDPKMVVVACQEVMRETSSSPIPSPEQAPVEQAS